MACPDLKVWAESGTTTTPTDAEIASGFSPCVNPKPTPFNMNWLFNMLSCNLKKVSDYFTGGSEDQYLTPNVAGDLIWKDLPGSSTVPNSTTDVRGIVELATVIEALAGIDTVRAITAAGLAAVIADAISGLGGGSSGAPMDVTSDSGGTASISFPVQTIDVIFHAWTHTAYGAAGHSLVTITAGDPIAASGSGADSEDTIAIWGAIYAA